MESTTLVLIGTVIVGGVGLVLSVLRTMYLSKIARLLGVNGTPNKPVPPHQRKSFIPKIPKMRVALNNKTNKEGK